MKKSLKQFAAKFLHIGKYVAISAITVLMITQLPFFFIGAIAVLLYNREDILKQAGYYSIPLVTNIAKYMVSDERRLRYKMRDTDNIDDRLKEVNDPDFLWGEVYENK